MYNELTKNVKHKALSFCTGSSVFVFLHPHCFAWNDEVQTERVNCAGNVSITLQTPCDCRNSTISETDALQVWIGRIWRAETQEGITCIKSIYSTGLGKWFLQRFCSIYRKYHGSRNARRKYVLRNRLPHIRRWYAYCIAPFSTDSLSTPWVFCVILHCKAFYLTENRFSVDNTVLSFSACHERQFVRMRSRAFAQCLRRAVFLSRKFKALPAYIYVQKVWKVVTYFNRCVAVYTGRISLKSFFIVTAQKYYAPANWSYLNAILWRWNAPTLSTSYLLVISWRI